MENDEKYILDDDEVLIMAFKDTRTPEEQQKELKEHFEKNEGKSGWYAIEDEIVLVNKGKKRYVGNKYKVYMEWRDFLYLYDMNLTENDLNKEEEKIIRVEVFPKSVFEVSKSDVTIVGYIGMENK